MKDLLIKTLEKFGYPVFLQGSLNEDEEYPPTFITFWTNDVADESHYDNDVVSYTWDFDVIIYSNDPSVIDTKKDEIRNALKSVGFIPQGKGMDISSDEPTHTGWVMNFYYLEN